MIKIFGFLILTLCGAYAGFLKSNQLKNRVDFYDKYIMFITHIKVSVSFSADILEGILQRVDIHYFDLYCAEITENLKNGAPFFDSWCDALGALNKDGFLSAKDLNLIMDFGKGLGTSDISGQISCCELASAKAEAAYKAYKEEYKNKSKLYKMLGAAAGVAVGLVMI